MQHVRFGRTGLSMSRLCLGTMTFGLQCDEEASRAILDAALDAGITFIDTANVYPGGGGPERVGATEEISDRYWTDEAFAVVDKLTALAQEAAVPPGQLAIAWVLANPVVTAPIIGATSPGQLGNAVRAVEEPLDADVEREIDELTKDFRKGDALR